MRETGISLFRMCLSIICIMLFGIVIGQLTDFRTASIVVLSLLVLWTFLVAGLGKRGQRAILKQAVRVSENDTLSDMETDLYVGRLVTASATTGWFDWIHGEVWLFSHGILRIRSGLGRTLMNGFGPTVDRQQMNIQRFSRQQLEQLQAKRSNRWTPREHIVKAYLHHGVSTDRLLLILVDGRVEKLLWLPIDNAFPVFRMVLTGWLGKKFVVD